MPLVQGQMLQLVSTDASIITLDPVNKFMGVLSLGDVVTTAVTTYYDAVTTQDLAYVLYGKTSSPFITIVDMTTERNATPYTVNPGSSARAIAVSPDGATIAVGMTGGDYICYYSYPGWVRTVGPNPGQGVYSIAWSPDGTKILVGLDASPWLKVYDVATGSDITPTFSVAPTNNAYSVAWSPDGTMIALGGTSTSSHGLRVWDFATGTQLFSAGSGIASRHVTFSPDSSLVAICTSSSGTSGIRIYNTSTWSSVTVTRTTEANGSARLIHFFDDDHIGVVTDYAGFHYKISTLFRRSQAPSTGRASCMGQSRVS
jgi:WD40 repeat protein